MSVRPLKGTLLVFYLEQKLRVQEGSLAFITALNESLFFKFDKGL